MTVARAPAACASCATTSWRERERFLREVTFDVAAQGSFPGAAEHEIECDGRGCNYDQECGQQFEENPILHFGASKR